MNLSNLLLYESLVACVFAGYFTMARDHFKENGGDLHCLVLFFLQGGPHLPLKR